MIDRQTLDKAKALFTGETQGDKLAREVVDVAERNAKKAALWEEVADQKDKELATLRGQRDELWTMLAPLKDAVLFARAQRRPMGIGQASDKAPTSTTLRIGVQFGRERYTDGFWIECDELGPADKDNPNPATRIAVELLRLAYAIADKVRT